MSFSSSLLSHGVKARNAEIGFGSVMQFFLLFWRPFVDDQSLIPRTLGVNPIEGQWLCTSRLSVSKRNAMKSESSDKGGVLQICPHDVQSTQYTSFAPYRT